MQVTQLSETVKLLIALGWKFENFLKNFTSTPSIFLPMKADVGHLQRYIERWVCSLAQ